MKTIVRMMSSTMMMRFILGTFMFAAVRANRRPAERRTRWPTAQPTRTLTNNNGNSSNGSVSPPSTSFTASSAPDRPLNATARASSPNTADAVPTADTMAMKRPASPLRPVIDEAMITPVVDEMPGNHPTSAPARAPRMLGAVIGSPTSSRCGGRGALPDPMRDGMPNSPVRRGNMMLRSRAARSSHGRRRSMTTRPRRPERRNSDSAIDRFLRLRGLTSQVPSTATGPSGAAPRSRHRPDGVTSQHPRWVRIALPRSDTGRPCTGTGTDRLNGPAERTTLDTFTSAVTSPPRSERRSRTTASSAIGRESESTVSYSSSGGPMTKYSGTHSRTAIAPPMREPAAAWPTASRPRPCSRRR